MIFVISGGPKKRATIQILIILWDVKVEASKFAVVVRRKIIAKVGPYKMLQEFSQKM